MKHYWSDYTSEAFAKLDHDKLIAVLPVGATEQHGPHLPISVDTTIGSGIVARLAERLPEDSPVLFLPFQAIGKSNEHLRYPGTLTHSAATLIAMWIEIGESVARSGVRKMVLLNSHGGNISVMDIVARELRVRCDMLVFCMAWSGFGMPDGLYTDSERRYGIHAGDMETSVMLALDPENVVMEKARDFTSTAQDWDANYRNMGLQSAIKPAWQVQDMNPGGACGNASLATAEKGEATLDHAVERILEAFEDIARVPLAQLANAPEWG
ncbi:creatininase family protein [Salipiger sp. 1_MG-2023]|uniref:creatininase family protein n=1 Tax=Salipiger sp. 1_MG-2023 TaxID=3062665 RepID=UPI0026E27DB6|nr:creatininase family protein [Salipiger sp. 1_MG-2023]MDO6585157.1 creatininase family protein [Salipiger sp. 1_MG-2023]